MQEKANKIQCPAAFQSVA